MRNPDRIDPMLEQIGSIWRKRPDLRLTQLVLNVKPDYNTEDDELVQRLSRMYGD